MPQEQVPRGAPSRGKRGNSGFSPTFLLHLDDWLEGFLEILRELAFQKVLKLPYEYVLNFSSMKNDEENLQFFALQLEDGVRVGQPRPESS